jgi:hypothetical protein
VAMLPNGLRAVVCSAESITRCELAVVVGCGSLDDPAGFEGLAHLAEHITLAADQTDARGLDKFIEERQGDLNAFTGERTTTFYSQYDLQRVVRRTASADSAALAAAAATSADVAAGCERFAAVLARALCASNPIHLCEHHTRTLQSDGTACR